MRIYYGITELEGDLFITVSSNKKIKEDNFNDKECEALKILEDYEIYESIENVYQAPPEEYTYDSIINLLNSLDFNHSEKLDDYEEDL